MAGSLILGVAYGIDVEPKDDPYIATAETALHAMSMAGNAGAYLVDSIPIRESRLRILRESIVGYRISDATPTVKHVPAWFPGASFKRQAAEWKKATDAMVERPFKAVRNAIVSLFTCLPVWVWFRD